LWWAAIPPDASDDAPVQFSRFWSMGGDVANGILLPLLHIVECGPSAQMVVLPSDHHVRKEAILARALCA